MHARRAGFTLFEIILVVVIIVLLATMAVPSVQGLLDERELQAVFGQFDGFVHQAQVRAVTERRAYTMVWDEDGITLRPNELTEDDAEAGFARFDFQEGSIILERPAALEKKPPMEWTFWRSGTCEPAIVRYEGSAGSWTVQYDPLTMRATFLEQQFTPGES
ncbi:MAG: prepilin-type N-terminal cleavage/methylation domain-containing protein [Verrucomicrobiota bacterium]|nr:prepilin-type N-terminal cleavage/methylation domain-containing protein [Verrucomicrobiota bacterium]